MNDEMASDWSAVIIAETRHMSDVQFADGCAKAKRECSDHRGVLKAILASLEDYKPDPLVSSFLSGWHGAKDKNRLAGPKTFKQIVKGWENEDS